MPDYAARRTQISNSYLCSLATRRRYTLGQEAFLIDYFLKAALGPRMPIAKDSEASFGALYHKSFLFPNQSNQTHRAYIEYHGIHLSLSFLALPYSIWGCYFLQQGLNL